MTKKKKYFRTLALAALLSVLLVSAACAAVAGGVLDYVFGGGYSVPTEKQKTMVQPIHVSAEAGGVNVTVTEAVFDGRMLAVGLSIDRRAYVLPAALMVDGQEASIQAVDEGFLMVNLTGGFTALTQQTVKGTVPVTLRVEVFAGDPYEEEPYDGASAPKLGEATLTFSVRADAEVQPMTLGEPLVDADVILEEAFLGDLQTRVALRIRERAGGMSQAEMQEKLVWFAFFDENRQPAPFQDAWYSGGSGWEEMPDGSLALVMEYTMPALSDVPQTLWVVPYNRDSSPDAPLWEYAIPLHPATEQQ